jgi:hypothetical protein
MVVGKESLIMLDNLDDPKRQALLMLAAGLMSPVRGRGITGFGEALGQGIQGGLLGYNTGLRTQEAVRRGEMERRLEEMRLEEMRRAQADQSYARQIAPNYFQPGNAPTDNMGPVMPPKADVQGYGMALAARNPQMGMPFITAGMKDDALLTVKEGDTLLDRNTMRPVYQAAPKPHWVDAGDSVIPVGPDGKPVGPAIRKNMAPGEAQRLGMDRARLGMEAGRYAYEIGGETGLPKKMQDAIAADIGKKQAEARFSAQQELPQVVDEARNVTALVDKLVSHPGFKTSVGVKGVTGTLANINPQLAQGSDAADWMALRDQIVGKQFMQAYQTLKGGGQITEVEGRKATEAIARMNTAQSENAFKEAAEEFKGIITAGVERAKKKAGNWSMQRVN